MPWIDGSLYEKKLIYQILRLNLIPAPRVLTPGPRTEFPVLFFGNGIEPLVVENLKMAEEIKSYFTREDFASCFFTDYHSPLRTVKIQVRGLEPLNVPDVPASPDSLRFITTWAVRAAYCLGFENAEVSIGLGTPYTDVLILDVKEDNSGTSYLSLASSRPHFPAVDLERIDCQYSILDPALGIVQPQGLYFHQVKVYPKGASKKTSALDLPRMALASPMPIDEVPLSTIVRFTGRPTQTFLRILDSTLAVLGMMISPLREVRRRNASGEGVLGNYEVSEKPQGFLYQTVPTILGQAASIDGLVALAKKVTDDPSRFASLDWRKDSLKEIHLWQKAFYGGDKGYFTGTLQRLSDCIEKEELSHKDFGFIETLLKMAWDSSSAATDGPFQKISQAAVPASIIVESGEGFLDGPKNLCLSGAKEQVNQKAETLVQVFAGPLQASLTKETILNGLAMPILFDGDLEDILTKRPKEKLSEGLCERKTVEVRVNPGLSGQLSLPTDLRYRSEVLFSRRRGIVFKIGPVIAIVAPPFSHGKRFGIEEDRFRQLIKMGRDMGILVYVVSPDDLGRLEDFGGKTIKGWLYRDNEGWFQEILPAPDVFYDRYIGSDIDLDASQPINSRPFCIACKDKMRTFGILSEDTLLRQHLPETQLVKEAKEALDFVGIHGKVFLKLVSGEGSKGVIRIEKQGERSPKDAPEYSVEKLLANTADEIEPSKEVIEGDDALFLFLEKSLQGQASGASFGRVQYLIQKAVEIGGPSVFEIRVIYQKGGRGRWLRTGMVSRVNLGPERFIVPKKEVHFRVDEVLGEIYPKRYRAIKEVIRNLSKRIPGLIERASGPGGEMSIDFAVDKEGKPWLIEVNSKPATLFRDIGAFGLRDLSMVRILNYAVYLFSEKELYT